MNKKTILNWIILLVLSIIWGSSFILMKRGLVAFSYLEVAFFRLIIAFFVLSPFLFASIKNIKKHHVIPILIVSLIGTVIPAIFFALSQTNLNSSTTGMLNSLTPIFTLMIGVFMFRKQWTKANIIGVIVALLGSYILLLPSSLNIIDTKYSLIVIIATICYAISINTIKDKLHDLNSLDIAVLSSFISFLIPAIFILNTGLSNTIYDIIDNTKAFYYLIILGTMCTSVAIVLFNYLIKRSSALFSSTTTYLIPVFAIIWGLIDHESVADHEFIGLFIILAGVFITNSHQLEL